MIKPDDKNLKEKDTWWDASKLCLIVTGIGFLIATIIWLVMR